MHCVSLRSAIKAKREAEEAAARKVLEEAKALANALSMIGKFMVKKTVGEDKRIFGSVTEAEVAAAIKQQTSQDIDKRNLTLPEIKAISLCPFLHPAAPSPTTRPQASYRQSKPKLTTYVCVSLAL